MIVIQNNETGEYFHGTKGWVDFDAAMLYSTREEAVDDLDDYFFMTWNNDISVSYQEAEKGQEQ